MTFSKSPCRHMTAKAGKGLKQECQTRMELCAKSAWVALFNGRIGLTTIAV